MPVIVIVSQIAVTVVIVGLYHLWVTGRKGATTPATPPPAAAAPPKPQPIALAAPPPAAQPAPIVAVQPAAKEVEPEIVAVIAAAIAVVLGRPHRMVSVQQSAQGSQASAWAMEGRVEHFQSHKFR
jgi:type IV secretory pathway VirB10-like protein